MRVIYAAAITLFVGSAAQAHSPLGSSGATLWAAWLSGLVLAVFWGAYLLGQRRRRVSWGTATLFHSTGLLAAFTLLGPLDHWAETSAAAHMTQHMLLMVVIPPLWVLCRPLPQLIAGGGRLGAAVWTPLLKFSRQPMLCAYLHGAIIWFWHIPYFYVLALHHPWWHVFEHACFIISAGLFWWAVLNGSYKRTPWALLALLFTLMHTGFLGALLTFAQTPLYRESGELWDQQLAGLIMWVCGAIPYLIASAWLSLRWYAQLARRTQS